MLDLGAFTIVRPLGAGGMAEVWSGMHRGTRLPVAVKLLAGATATDGRYRRVFRREVEAVAALDHPAIVMIFDHGLTPADSTGRTDGAIRSDVPYLVMEHASGGALDEHPPSSWSHIRLTLLSILDALAHAHARGVIHRDLKPANLLVCGPEDMRPGVKLADFGLAHRYWKGKALAAGAGTPTHMAPEQVRGDWMAFGPWTDLYAVGVLGWEWVTGSTPFAGDDTATILHAQLHRPLPNFHPRIAVPEGLQSWLRALLEKAPADRLPHAAVAMRHLLALPEVDEDGATATPKPPPPSAFFTLVPAIDDVDMADEVERAAPLPSLRSTTFQMPKTWKTRPTMRPPRGVPNAGIGLIGVRPPPFLGRVKERDRMWDILGEVVREHRIRGVLVRGPTGVGKTRLAEWICCRAMELGIAEVWDVQHGPDAEASRPIAELEAKLDGQSDVPLIARIDDLQWAESGRRLAQKVLKMAHIVRRPLMMLLITGPVDGAVAAQIDAIARLDAVTSIALGPLSKRETTRLVTQVLGVDLTVASQVRDTSMGNPMVVIEILRGWAAQQDLVSREHGFALKDSATVPANISELWNKRLAPYLKPLSAPDLHAVLLAAILGTRVREVEWAAGCKRAGLPMPLEVVDKWTRAGLLDPWSTGFRWRQEVARQSLVERARAEGLHTHLNWVCADLIRARGGNAERIGTHLAASGAWDEAFAPLMAGARLRVDDNDYGRATVLIDLAERCLEQASVPATDPRYAEAVVKRVLCLINLWELARAAQTGEAFLETCDVPGWEAAETEMMGLVGLACYRLGRLDEAERWLMGSAGDHHPLNIQMRVTRGLGQIAQSRGQLDVAEQYYQDFAHLAGQSDSPFQRACAINDLSSIAVLRGDLVTAERLTRRGLAICEEHGYRDAMTGRTNLCGQLLARGAYREARAAIGEILGQGDAAWSPVVRVMVQVFLLRIHTALGQWQAWEVARLELDALLKYEDWAEHSMARVLGEGAAEAAAAGHIDEAQYMGRIALEQWGRLGLGDKAEALRETLASWA